MDNRAGESNPVRTPIGGAHAMHPVHNELAFSIEA
jgi:hypothetical protein